MSSLFITDITDFFVGHQNLLWFLTVAIDLSMALALFRLFGKTGLYAIIVLNIMLTNLQGPKLTDILGMQTSLGVILYASIFFATDLLSEKYGQKEANRAVLIGFATSVAVVVMMSISLLFLPSQHPGQIERSTAIHEAIRLLFDYTPLFVFGSLFVYLVSQSLDVWIFHYVKKKTGGKHLWLRNNVSTMISQAVDTVLYALIVWMPIVGLTTALKLSAAKYVFKVLIAIIDTPFIYIARKWDVSRRDWSEKPEPEPHANPKIKLDRKAASTPSRC